MSEQLKLLTHHFAFASLAWRSAAALSGFVFRGVRHAKRFGIGCADFMPKPPLGGCYGLDFSFDLGLSIQIFAVLFV